jgi:hypothetical protein
MMTIFVAVVVVVIINISAMQENRCHTTSKC